MNHVPPKKRPGGGYYCFRVARLKFLPVTDPEGVCVEDATGRPRFTVKRIQPRVGGSFAD